MYVNAYLFFNGRCEEALDFYQTTLGARVEMLMRNRDNPQPPPPGMLPPGSEDKILHAALRIGDTVVMASDGQCNGGTAFQGFGLSVSPDSPAAAEQVFAALGDGGSVVMPLGPTFWSPAFGMLTDRFGVLWMVNVMPATPAA